MLFELLKKEKNRLEKLSLVKVYNAIKKSCRFQKRFSCSLLVIFFLLQYSVPVFLVVLGSVATSREQLNLFFHTVAQQDFEEDSIPNLEAIAKEQADILVSRIIFLIGLITILLGVINNITRPTESYDICAKFHNRFCKFENDLNLQFIKVGNLPGADADSETVQLVSNFLLKKNEELFQLIDEFNDARSLSPRQANIQLLNQDEDTFTDATASRSLKDFSQPTVNNSQLEDTELALYQHNSKGDLNAEKNTHDIKERSDET